jgi:hypothetical protein
MLTREVRICIRRVLTRIAAPCENGRIRLCLADPFARHAVDHCLDLLEALETHCNLVAHLPRVQLAMAFTHWDLRAPRKSVSRGVHRGGGGGGGPAGPADAGSCRTPVAKTAPMPDRLPSAHCAVHDRVSELCSSPSHRLIGITIGSAFPPARAERHARKGNGVNPKESGEGARRPTKPV